MSFDSFRIDFFGDMFSFSGGNFVVFVFVGFALEGFIFLFGLSVNSWHLVPSFDC